MERHDLGRFTVASEPRDEQLARSLLQAATANDTFPWLPRPRERVLILIARDHRQFRELVGPAAPEYGAAIAIPEEQKIVMQGSAASSEAGDPRQVLRHELAHLALHEQLNDLPSRWFDEGYASVAAGEWGSDDMFAINVALAVRGMPSLDALDERFAGGAQQATAAYALAERAVIELAALDPERGLTLFFEYWRSTQSFEAAIRRAFGLTEGQFEERWRSRTEQRYGALAVFADLTLGVLVLLVFITPLYLARRRRDKHRLEHMLQVEQAALEKERLNAIDELLRGVTPPHDENDAGTIGG